MRQFFRWFFFLGLFLQTSGSGNLNAQQAVRNLLAPLEAWPLKTGYVPGSFRFGEYLNQLKGKRVGLVVNHTSRFRGVHLVDTLLAQGVRIERIFAPEHGFRGDKAEGVKIDHSTDSRTGIAIVSLYGKNKKPSPAQLADLDVVLFDIQDVGARFYTYISTLKEVMEACAEQGKPLILADRFNPLGFCSGGPILDLKHQSFVGAFPIPIVHGLTMAELARMAVKKEWFKEAKKLKLNVVPCLGYRHSDTLFPEVAPSPNLRTPLAILAYPSLCLFEGTNWSMGRGTEFPFEVFGFPDSACGTFRFRPARSDSSAPKPVHNGLWCYGERLQPDSLKSCFSLKFLIRAYRLRSGDPRFFNSFFYKLAGVDYLQEAIQTGKEPEFDLGEWEKDREKVRMYPK